VSLLAARMGKDLIQDGGRGRRDVEFLQPFAKQLRPTLTHAPPVGVAGVARWRSMPIPYQNDHHAAAPVVQISAMAKPPFSGNVGFGECTATVKGCSQVWSASWNTIVEHEHKVYRSKIDNQGGSFCRQGSQQP